MVKIIRTKIIVVAMFVATTSVYGQGFDGSNAKTEYDIAKETLGSMGSSEARQAERNSTGIHRDASPEFKERAMESARREDANRTQIENWGKSLGSGSNSSSSTSTSSGNNDRDSRDSRSSYGGSYNNSGSYIPYRPSSTPVAPKYEYNGKYYNTVAERDAAKKAAAAEAERVRKNTIQRYYNEATTTRTIYQTSGNPYKIENPIDINEVESALYGNNTKPVEIESDIFLTISNKPIEIKEDNNANSYIFKFISQQTLTDALSTTSEAVSTTINVLNSRTTNEILSTTNEILPDNTLLGNILNDFKSIIPEMKEDLEKARFNLDLALATLGDSEKQKQVIDNIYNKFKEVVTGLFPAGETFNTGKKTLEVGLSYEGHTIDFVTELKEGLLSAANGDFKVLEDSLDKWRKKYGFFSKDGIETMSGTK